MPALVVVAAVIVFPWLFTLCMSRPSTGRSGGERRFVGLDNYQQLVHRRALPEAVVRTFYFTALAVVAAAGAGHSRRRSCFHRQFPLRGLARAVFILPMMATPVAVALVWTMMFHPQLGVLNYLLSLVGLPPSLWVYSPTP